MTSIVTHLKREQGFTLLEITIAIAILSIGLLAVATMQTTAIKGNARAFGITEGITLAQDRAERIARLAFNDAILNDGAGTNDGSAGLDDNPNDATNPLPDQADPSNPILVGGVGRPYNVYWNVADDWPIANTKTIRVIVLWTDKGAQKRASVDVIRADII